MTGEECATFAPPMRASQHGRACRLRGAGRCHAGRECAASRAILYPQMFAVTRIGYLCS
ncbi:hypothetical protein PT2222_160096 [Paraburkholderia tropica]